MSKEHKIKLAIVYCPRCRASHPPGEHLAKPKKALPAEAQQTVKALAKDFAEYAAPKLAGTKGAPKGKKALKADLARKITPHLAAAATEVEMAHGYDQLQKHLDDNRANAGVVPDILKGDGAARSPKARHKKISGMARRKVKAAVEAAIPAVAEQMLGSLMDKGTAEGDGVALVSMAHPKGPGVGRGRGRLHKAALETMEAPAAVAAELDRLGEAGVAKRMAERKKRTKAEAQALVDEVAARKRALKAARQARWRAGKVKPKKRKAKK